MIKVDIAEDSVEDQSIFSILLFVILGAGPAVLVVQNLWSENLAMLGLLSCCQKRAKGGKGKEGARNGEVEEPPQKDATSHETSSASETNGEAKAVAWASGKEKGSALGEFAELKQDAAVEGLSVSLEIYPL